MYKMTPHDQIVNRRTVVASLRQNLRRHVSMRAAQSVQEPVGSDLLLDGGESEIGDFQVAVLVEEEVLRLEIAVEDAARVAESDLCCCWEHFRSLALDLAIIVQRSNPFGSIRI